ncbi:class I SAM-dependent methyltransferase [Demequina zhanjiangensis]|uniref:Class I SAM-dependent methyltransferase n=1 Tax=Demequina zhanjiangensis TaxID=3051659 RepID=A0ABT8G2H7_9MICO|nr:class I SAM-dependent methyltransferase [Demequina sp. SYSU T00b26]MDN4473298.1 class I SAM-dependent methyltransferase [Demequina sp. SYSU T00b26]
MDHPDDFRLPAPDHERREFWNARYAAGAAWSGHVNPALEQVASALEPGTALDLGCGEGGDVLWLAEHGWSATGIDGAAPALARAREEASRRSVGSRATFVEADLSQWWPELRWDLVTCHYLHEAAALRESVLRAAAGAVAPGGTLLVVGHHPDEPEALQGPHRDQRFTAEALAGSLQLGDGWAVRAASRPRTSVREGRTVERLDAVLIAEAPAP